MKNSYDFMEKIKDIIIPDNHILISSDVTSLYTNVSKKLVIESIKKIFPEISNKFKIPLNEMVKGVKLIMGGTYFNFKNKFYHQIHGLPMGGPCSTVFSDIVMEDSETNYLKKLDFLLSAYYRFVDDIFTIIL